MTPKRKRWFKYSVLAMLFLALAIVVSVQVVLSWTNIPRDLVIGTLQARTGLVVEIDSLDTTWWGTTAVRGVRVMAADQIRPMLTAKLVRVRHASLIGLAFTGDVGLSYLQVDDADLQLQQDATGRWNIMQVIEKITRESSPDKNASSATMPQIQIRQATVGAHFDDGRHVTLFPVWAKLIQGTSEAPHSDTATVTLRFGELGTAKGWFNLSGDHGHELHLLLNDLTAVRPMLDQIPVTQAKADILWTGTMAQSKLTGQAVINDLQVLTNLQDQPGRLSLSGQIGIALDQKLELAPFNIKVIALPWLPEPAVIETGTVVYDGRQLALSGLKAKTFGGDVGAQGSYSFADQTAQAVLNWRGITYPQTFKHSGSMNLSANRHGPLGQVASSAKIITQGSSPAGDWDSTFDLTAQGASWNNFDWVAQVATANVAQSDTSIKFDEAKLEGYLRDKTIAVTSMSMPLEIKDHGKVKLAGQGEYDIQHSGWSLKVHADSAPALNNTLQVAGDLKAKGGNGVMTAELANFKMGQISGSAQVRMDDRAKQQTQGSFELHLEPPAPVENDPYHPAQDKKSTRVTWKQAMLKGQVTGEHSPLDMKIRAQATATGLALSPQDQTDESITIDFTGSATQKGVTLQSRQFALSGGMIQVRAEHVFETQRSMVAMTALHLPLTVLDRIARSPLGIKGRVNLDLAAGMNQFDPQTLDVSGKWTARGVEHRYLPLTQATGKIVLRDGNVRLVDVLAQSGRGKARGTIESSMTSLNALKAELEVDNWPLRSPGTQAYRADATGKIKLSGDLSTRQFRGPAELNLTLLKNDWAFFSCDLDMQLNDELLDIRSLKAELLDGELKGAGQIHLDDMTKSHAKVSMKAVDLSRLKAWQPLLSSLKGRVEGDLVLEPVKDKRALGPMRLIVQIKPVDLRVERVELDAMNLLAYIGPDRLLVHDLNLSLASGKMHAWGRVTRQQNEWFGFAQSNWSNLNFDQLASLMLIVQTPVNTASVIRGQQQQMQAKTESADTAVTKESVKEPVAPDKLQKATTQPVAPVAKSQPIPGLFDGHLQVAGPINDWTKASGSGEVQVSQSDLLRVPIFNELYALFNVVGSTSKEPEGYGQAAFRLEGPAFILTDAAYINRGMSVNIRLRVSDLRQGMASPIQGLAVGIFNPLPVLPGVQRYVDAIMNYQGNATSVAIKGRLNERNIQRVPSSFIGQLTRELLQGDNAAAGSATESATESTDDSSAVQPISAPEKNEDKDIDSKIVDPLQTGPTSEAAPTSTLISEDSP